MKSCQKKDDKLFFIIIVLGLYYVETTHVMLEKREVHVLSRGEGGHIPLLDTLLKVVEDGAEAGIVVQHEGTL